MKKILLIDDSNTYIWYLQKYLQRRGYLAETASTLKEARTAIYSNHQKNRQRQTEVV